MKLKSKIIIALSLATIAAVGGTTAGLVVGLNRQEDSKTGVDFNSLASVKKIDYKKPPSDPEVKMKEVKPPETPEDPVAPTPTPTPEPEPEKEPEKTIETKEPEVVQLQPEPEPEKEVAPLPTPTPVTPKVEEPKDNPAINVSGTSTNKVLTQAELIELITDKGESAALAKGYTTKGGVGTNRRREGKNSSVSQPDKFDYEALSAGSQDSAVVLAALVRAGVTIENLPTLTEPVSLETLNKLRENALRFTGQKILNLTEEDKKKLLEEFNETLWISVGDNINKARVTMNDIQSLKEKAKAGTLTASEKNVYDSVKERIENVIKNRPGTYNSSIKSFEDVKPKTSFTADEIKILETGQLPDSLKPDGSFGGTFQNRAQFVNEVQFNTTRANMSRFLKIESNWERTWDSIMGLDFKAWKGEGTNSGYNKSNPIPIPGYDGIAHLLEYTNLRDSNDNEKRYIIEVTRVDKLDSVNNLVKEAQKLMKNQFGSGLAIRNINTSNMEKATETVKNMPGSIKSLTLFYDSDNPKAIHALIDNPNFNTSDKTLVELNVYTDISTRIDDRNTAVERTTTLTRIDPRVYQRVNPTAYDYKYNTIFLTMGIAKPTTRREIGDIMRYVYVTARTRREFQGEMGGIGGYPTMWDFRDGGNMYEFNNVQIPNIPNFTAFTKVTFSSLINGKAIMDMRNIQIDNSDKVQYEVGRPNVGIFYANTTPIDDPNSPTTNTLVIVGAGTSSRGLDADIKTVSNHMVRSWQFLNEIDFSDVKLTDGTLVESKMTEAKIKSTNWPVNVRTIKLNGKTYKRETDFTATTR
ncbi:hypothetical protein [Mycoplasmopsis agassizii]|uniref:hypothetical protein n=1 Tax=Mycoplasmopsis agassizii TaxID=33922 RepID=UPI0015DA610D|nr:hypothetical protein [Mycoplasmopsis agassizii]